MAFPRKHNRRLVVGEETYCCYLNDNEHWRISQHIAVRRADMPSGQLLLIALHSEEYRFQPRYAAEGIAFALANGWTPQERKRPCYLGFVNQHFVVLPSPPRITPNR